MVQFARSGKQNIAEAYLEKSLKMYIKLLGAARGSLGELLEDFESKGNEGNTGHLGKVYSRQSLYP